MAKTNAQVALEAAVEIAKAGATSERGGLGWLNEREILGRAETFYNWLEKSTNL